MVLYTTGKHCYQGTHFPLTASRSFQALGLSVEWGKRKKRQDLTVGKCCSYAVHSLDICAVNLFFFNL